MAYWRGIIGAFAAMLFILSPVDAFAADGAAFTIPRTTTHALQMDGTERRFDVYVKLPAGYHRAENADRRYPVIYLNDGPYTFQVASGTTRLPMGAGKMQPVILVGLSFAKGEGGMKSRVLDLTHETDASWKKYETGGGPRYFKFLQQQVIPMIEEAYRADPKQRTLSGQSLGGSFGAWVMLERPGTFSGYILTSPSLWYKNRDIFTFEADYAKSQTDLAATAYFAVGGKETLEAGMGYPMAAQLTEFVSTLEGRKYPNLKIMSEVIPGAIHETTFPQGFIRGMQWMYPARD